MAASHNEAVEVYEGLEDDETIERKPWQFQPGNQASVGQSRDTGIVKYIKKITNGGTEMIDMLVKVMRGDEEKLGFPVNANHRIDAVNHLLDRAIGKPKQTIEETGDEHGKEVLASLQALLHVRSADSTTDAPIAPDESKVSAIEQMKRKALPEREFYD